MLGGSGRHADCAFGLVRVNLPFLALLLQTGLQKWCLQFDRRGCVSSGATFPTFGPVEPHGEPYQPSHPWGIVVNQIANQGILQCPYCNAIDFAAVPRQTLVLEEGCWAD